MQYDRHISDWRTMELERCTLRYEGRINAMILAKLKEALTHGIA